MDAVEDDYQIGIVRGATQVAELANVQLVCVAGGVVGDARADRRSERNFLFDLIDPRQFGGVLSLSGSLRHQLGIPKFAEFLRKFSTLPVVNLGVEIPSSHSIT